MSNETDTQLLRRYTESRSEESFTFLVSRHVDFVYSSALRMVSDSHLAKDVTQGVFIALAKNAVQLTNHPVLSGWLHRTARNLASETIRTNVRRQAREQEAAAMNELLSTESDASWDDISPKLDAALGELNEPDRDALLLRYFEKKSAREMSQTLGISDEAAQKRVNRAVDRLRDIFSKQGFTLGASGLVGLISVNAVQAAPIGLTAAIATSVSLAGTTILTPTVITTVKTIAMTTLQKTLITATIAVAVGTGIYEANKAAALQRQLHILEQQQVPLTAQLTELQMENERLSNLVAQAKDSQGLSKEQFSELLKLRGKSSLAQSKADELAQLKTTLAQQGGKMPDYFTNAMSLGLSTAEKWKKKDAEARLARMKKMLQLTDAQAQAINDIMQQHIQRDSQMVMDMISGKLTLEQRKAQALESTNQETEIKALLTAEQLASYPEYQQAEKITAATNSAASEARQIAADYSLSPERQEQLRASLYQMNLQEPTKGLNQAAISEAKKNGDFMESANLGIALQQSKLEEKLKILEGFLSLEQTTKYRQEKIDQINLQAEAMKMYLPPKTVGSKD